MSVCVIGVMLYMLTLLGDSRTAGQSFPRHPRETAHTRCIQLHENGQNSPIEEVGVCAMRCSLFAAAEDYVASLSTHFSAVDGHFYDANGLIVSSCASVAPAGDAKHGLEGGDERGCTHLFFVAVGKLFIWPTISLGFRRTLTDVTTLQTHDAEEERGEMVRQPVQMQTLSHSPRVFALSNMVTSKEASDLVEHALSNEGKDDDGDFLQRSTVATGGGQESEEEVGSDSDVGRDRYSEAHKVSAARTGQTAWEAGSPLALALQTRVLALLRVSRMPHLPVDATWIEEVQVLRYEHDEMFAFHYDFHQRDRKSAPSDGAASAADEDDNFHSYDTENGGTDRFATVLFYLSDVAQGGCTAFANAEEWWDSDLQRVVQKTERELEVSQFEHAFALASSEDSVRHQCACSLAVRPRRLHALLLYSQTLHGGLDWASKHAGCPVGEGETKWVANVWVWNGPRRPYWHAQQQYHSSDSKLRPSARRLSEWRFRNAPLFSDDTSSAPLEEAVNWSEGSGCRGAPMTQCQFQSLIIRCEMVADLTELPGARLTVFRNDEFQDVLTPHNSLRYCLSAHEELDALVPPSSLAAAENNAVWDIRLVALDDGASVSVLFLSLQSGQTPVCESAGREDTHGVSWTCDDALVSHCEVSVVVTDDMIVAAAQALFVTT